MHKAPLCTIDGRKAHASHFPTISHDTQNAINKADGIASFAYIADSKKAVIEISFTTIDGEVVRHECPYKVTRAAFNETVQSTFMRAVGAAENTRAAEAKEFEPLFGPSRKKSAADTRGAKI